CRNFKFYIYQCTLDSIYMYYFCFLTLIKEIYGALQSLIKSNIDTLDRQQIANNIKHFEELRCSNFAEDKSRFIASALNRTKRSIVLDRAMSTNSDGFPTLLTDKEDIFKEVNNHFQTIAGN